jgi:NADH:ubiquinone oxidoreductase subunit E
MITEEQASQAVTDILSSHKREKKNLIPLLQEVQTSLGYLPREAMQKIAGFLEMPEVEVCSIREVPHCGLYGDCLSLSRG